MKIRQKSRLFFASVLSIGIAASALIAYVAMRPQTAQAYIATGSFYTSGTHIIDPSGKEFIPIGANVGTTNSFDWSGVAQGHADDAKAWGWNTVRLNLLVTDAASWSYVAQNGPDALLTLVDSLVSEYTSKGIVVMLVAHDDPYPNGAVDETIAGQMDTFWSTVAAKYKSNPYVWFNPINEPSAINQAWHDLYGRFTADIRNAGAQNLIVLDAPVWGQDIGSRGVAGAKYGYEASMAPALAQQYGNVVYSAHGYGTFGLYSSEAGFRNYVNLVHAAGLPLIIGEFGYRLDGGPDPTGYADNKQMATTIFDTSLSQGVGFLWWHATHGDSFALKDSASKAFYSDGPGNNLSPAGQRLWDIGHNYGIDTIAPSIAVNGVKDGDTVSGSTNVTVQASDNGSIAALYVYIGGKLIGQVTASSYQTTINTTAYPNGPLTIEAVAYDLAGNRTVKDVVVTVSGSSATGSEQAPGASFTSPFGGSSLHGTVPLSITSHDMNSIDRVEYYNGSSSMFGTARTAPFTLSIDTTSLPDGPIWIQGRAINKNGLDIWFSTMAVINNSTVTTTTAPSSVVVPQNNAGDGVTALNLSGNCSATPSVSSSVAPASIPANMKILTGLTFTAQCASIGQIASVSIDLKKTYDVSKIHVFKRATDGTLTDITSQVHAATGATTTVGYAVTDGAALDDDAQANGMILDPVYVALDTTATPDTPPTTTPSTGGSSTTTNTGTTSSTSSLASTGASVLSPAIMALGAIVGGTWLVLRHRNS